MDPSIGVSIAQIILIAPKSIAIGIVQATTIFAIGERRDICPNWNITIGSEKANAERVRIKASLIARNWGRKKNIRLKKSCVYIIHIIAKKLSWKLISYSKISGEYNTIHTAVNESNVSGLTLCHCSKKRYATIHMMAARTTGAHNPTNTVKSIILPITKIARKIGGIQPKIRVTNITQIVILKPLTAIKCVSHELLKSSCRSFGIFSLAQRSIPPRNIASLPGYKESIIDKNLCL